MSLSVAKLGCALVAVISVAAAQDMAIDVERSTITIHVDKAGLFSAAGHEHWVSAPISSGTIRESPSPFVEFTVQTAQNNNHLETNCIHTKIATTAANKPTVTLCDVAPIV